MYVNLELSRRSWREEYRNHKQADVRATLRFFDPDDLGSEEASEASSELGEAEIPLDELPEQLLHSVCLADCLVSRDPKKIGRRKRHQKASSTQYENEPMTKDRILLTDLSLGRKKKERVGETFEEVAVRELRAPEEVEEEEEEDEVEIIQEIDVQPRSRIVKSRGGWRMRLEVGEEEGKRSYRVPMSVYSNDFRVRVEWNRG